MKKRLSIQKTIKKLSEAFLVMALLLAPGIQLNAQLNKYFDNRPSGAQPEAIGRKLTANFIELPHTNFGAKGLPGFITYPEACTWFGAIIFSQKIGDNVALAKLTKRYNYLTIHEQSLLPKPDFVDNNVFGIVPLALYNITGQSQYLRTGKYYADKEWELPTKTNSRRQDMFNKGLS